MLFPSFARSSSNIFIFLSRRYASWASVLTITLAAVCPAAHAQSTAPQVTYTITDLGVLPGGDQPGYQGSGGNAINASGDVAGFSSNSAGVPHPVLFRGGKVIDLGFVSPPFGGMAYGLNGYDQVTGELEFLAPGTPDGVFNHAFLYSAGRLSDIGTAPGYDSGYGTSINDSGQIAGVSTLKGSPSPSQVFLYRAGEFTNIPNFYAPVAGNNINASGQIAGESQGRAGLFIDGSIQLLDLPIPPSFPSRASAINDFGQATGYLDYRESDTHAFLYSNGNGVDIGALPGDQISYGNSINVAGQIVGISNNPTGNHPFLYTPGQGMISLQSLLPASSKWQLTDTTAINDKGQITGAGINPQGYQHAYLLSPVFVPFSTLDAVVDITGPSKTTFAVGGRFTLGAKSNGIDLLKDTAVLQLGGYHIALPPSSFVEKNGIYTYHGKIGNVTLQVTGRQVARNIYLFGVVGQGAAGLPKDYPLNLVLTIGNDTGSEEIKANYGADNLTEAEVCRNFGLTCDN